MARSSPTTTLRLETNWTYLLKMPLRLFISTIWVLILHSGIKEINRIALNVFLMALKNQTNLGYESKLLMLLVLDHTLLFWSVVLVLCLLYRRVWNVSSSTIIVWNCDGVMERIWIWSIILLKWREKAVKSKICLDQFGDEVDWLLPIWTIWCRFYLAYEGTSHGYKFSKLNECTNYIFRISARNEVGEGPYSDEVTFATTRALPPTLKSIDAVNWLLF